jgi:hypothetical protein
MARERSECVNALEMLRSALGWPMLSGVEAGVNARDARKTFVSRCNPQ